MCAIVIIIIIIIIMDFFIENNLNSVYFIRFRVFKLSLMHHLIFFFSPRGQFIVYRGGNFDRPAIDERVWRNNDFNFDDVSQGMLTLFTVATFEGWPEYVRRLLCSYYGFNSEDLVRDLLLRLETN